MLVHFDLLSVDFFFIHAFKSFICFFFRRELDICISFALAVMICLKFARLDISELFEGFKQLLLSDVLIDVLNKKVSFLVIFDL